MNGARIDAILFDLGGVLIELAGVAGVRATLDERSLRPRR